MKFIKNIFFSFALLLIYGFIFSHGSYAHYLNWKNTTSLPQEISNSSSITYNGYIYEVGGNILINGMPNSVNSVYYARIQSNHTLGNWNSTTSIPNNVSNLAVESNGYIYLLGNTVYYSQIQSNGTLSIWNSTSSISQNINNPSIAAYGGYIYKLGGYNQINGTLNYNYLNTVYYSQIQSNGTLGVWNSTTSLPVDDYDAVSLAYNGDIYYIYTGTIPSQLSIYYSQIQSNGTLGVWNSTNHFYPSNSYSDWIYPSNYFIINGYIYGIGGNTGMVYSNINSNGTLGTWNYYSQSNSTCAFVGISGESVATYNNIAYILGGGTYDSAQCNNTIGTSYSYSNAVYVSQLRDGYSILSLTGNLYNFGTNNYGDMSNIPNGVPSKQGVGFAENPTDTGYYILTSDGGIYTFGNAQFYGSVYNIPNAPVKTPVAIVATPDGNGYYVLTADGGVYTFGDAVFHGSLFNIPQSAIPDKTPVAFGVTPDGGGYYIVTQNGAVYTFGDAQFHGSTYNIPNAPVKTTVAFAVTNDGNGYYMVTADGGVYTFGDAQFYGSMFNITNPPVRTPVAFKLSIDGLGYYMVTADGGVYTFGDANFLGSIAGVATPTAIQ